MQHWLNVGVRGGGNWPKEETTVKFGGHDLVLKPATRTTEQSVHIALSGISDVDALTLINRFLSIISWCADQAMENLYGWSGNPKPIAVPLAFRSLGSSPFLFYRELPQDRTVRLALALFREGATVNSVPFAFLSYFKILNIFWQDKYVKGANAIIEGIRMSLPQLTDDLAKKRIAELLKTEPDVSNYLYQSCRCAVAHAFSSPIVDPDDVSELRRLSSDIDIVKNIAERLIENQLKVSRSLLG